MILEDHLLNGSSHLFSSLLSFLQSSSARQQTATLHSIQPIIQSNPSLFNQSSFLHSFTPCLSSIHPSVLEAVLDILLLLPSKCTEQSLLFRTAIQKSFHLQSHSLLLKAFQLLQHCIHYLLSLSPLDIATLLSFLQLLLKNCSSKLDSSCQSIATSILQSIWCIEEPSLTHQALQDKFTSFLLTAHSSLVPQDNEMETFVLSALQQPSIQPFFLNKLSQFQFSNLQENNLKTLLFISKCISTIPADYHDKLFHYLQSTILSSSSSHQILFLQSLYNLLPFIESSSILSIQQQLLVLLNESSSISSVKELVMCFIQTSRILIKSTKQDNELLTFLSHLIENLSSSNEIIQKRSIVIIGYMYQEMDREIYMNIVNQSIQYEFSSLALKIEELFSSNTLQEYCFPSYYHILLHNPSCISSTMISHTISVCYSV